MRDLLPGLCPRFPRSHRLTDAVLTGTFSGYFTPNITAKAQAIASAQRELNGLTFNCAVYTILQNTTWSPENITYGDGFAHLVGFSASRLVPLLRAGNPDDPTVLAGPAQGNGFAVRASPADLNGASYWMLNWCAMGMMGDATTCARRAGCGADHAHISHRVASQANVTFNFDVVRLPGNIYYGTSKNDTAARVIYLLDTLGYDCVVGTIFIQPQRMQFMRYVISHQPYGYQVVTKAPVYVSDSIRNRLFKWTLPFERNLWITIGCSVTASAIAMLFFEHDTEGEDFPLQTESWGRKAARSLFYSAMGVSTVDNYHPRTNEGRMYVAVTAFVFFVIMSSYTAQLTAILANKQVPYQAITSIDSFAQTGSPVCVRQNAAQQQFLATFYPKLQVQPIPGLTQAGLLPAIVSGLCAGGVGPDPELKYALGGPGIQAADGFDPTDSFCDLEIVGDRLTFGYYGIPFKRNDTVTVNERTLHAISVLMDLAIDQGNYTSSASATFFPLPENRAVCAAQAAALEAEFAASASTVLQLEDLSGLFIMEGAALVLAVIIRARRVAAAAVKKARAAALVRRRMELKASKRLDKAAAPMGGEAVPAWQTGDAQGAMEEDDDSDTDLDMEALTTRLELREGGMEGRLATMVASQTGALSAEMRELRARLDAKDAADAAFQRALLDSLAGTASRGDSLAALASRGAGQAARG